MRLFHGFVGSLLILTGIIKSVTPAVSLTVLEQDGLGSPWLRGAVLTCLVAAELTIGCALVTGVSRPLVLRAAKMLFTAFVLQIAFIMLFNPWQSCGCFGSLHIFDAPAHKVIWMLFDVGVALSLGTELRSVVPGKSAPAFGTDPTRV